MIRICARFCKLFLAVFFISRARNLFVFSKLFHSFVLSNLKNGRMSSILRNVISSTVIGQTKIGVPSFAVAALSITAVSAALVAFYTADQLVDSRSDLLRKREFFDFIIVGAGSAGCVLANRLSADPEIEVLLLEAGGEPHPFQSVPLLAFNLLSEDYVDWKFRTHPSPLACRAYKDGVCTAARGKGLGGSSNLNYMIYTRGHPNDFMHWEEVTGDSRWGYENVLRYYKKSENYMGIYTDERYHGTGGPLTVRVSPYAEGKKLAKAFVDAGVEHGYESGDVNSESFRQTFTPIESTITADGKRASTYQAFLAPVRDRPNLHVYKYAYVTKVLTRLNSERQLEAYGVEYIRHGVTTQAFVRKEVILSAGALLSPHILMHSGIGPADELERHQIQVKLNLPGVGRNLQDHVGGYLGPFIIDEKISFIAPRDVNTKNAVRYTVDGTGVFSSSTCPAIGHVLSSQAKGDTHQSNWPDIQFLLLGVGLFPSMSVFFEHASGVPAEKIRKAFEPAEGRIQDAFFIVNILTRPKSRGRILLADSDPRSPPLVDVKLLSHPDDIQRLVEGSRLAVDLVLNSTVFQRMNIRMPNIPFPGCEKFKMFTLGYWECYHRELTISVYHYAGTCAMGKRSHPSSVVDSELKVIGVRNLRVVDASVMPIVVNTNTNAPTIMIAELGSQLLLNR